MHALCSRDSHAVSFFKEGALRYTNISLIWYGCKALCAILEEVRKMIDAGHGAEYAATEGSILAARRFSPFLAGPPLIPIL